VSVLLAAFRPDHEHHDAARSWLERTLRSDNAYGVSELALSAFLRIATNPRAIRDPNTLDEAVAFADAVLRPSHAIRVGPGARHWDIFTRLCRDAQVRGDLITDAYYAALAIEHGCEWITLDGDFARFPGLKWRRPS
jgi:toxin-antitoxin system PIN domain toxin